MIRPGCESSLRSEVSTQYLEDQVVVIKDDQVAPAGVAHWG